MHQNARLCGSVFRRSRCNTCTGDTPDPSESTFQSFQMTEPNFSIDKSTIGKGMIKRKRGRPKKVVGEGFLNTIAKVEEQGVFVSVFGTANMQPPRVGAVALRANRQCPSTPLEELPCVCAVSRARDSRAGRPACVSGPVATKSPLPALAGRARAAPPARPPGPSPGRVIPASLNESHGHAHGSTDP